MFRQIVRAARRLGLYQIEYAYGSVSAYCVQVWGTSVTLADEVEDYLVNTGS